MKLVARGVCPERLENPRMGEYTWNLVQRCWMLNPSERPTMDETVVALTVAT